MLEPKAEQLSNELRLFMLGLLSRPEPMSDKLMRCMLDAGIKESTTRLIIKDASSPSKLRECMYEWGISELTANDVLEGLSNE